MKHERNITMKRIVSVSATLDENDIERALVREALAQAAPDLFDKFGGPALGPGKKFTATVSLSSRSGEAEVNVKYEEEMEVAP